MTALLVGGDYIEALKRELIAHGLTRVEHWDGRRSRFTKRRIPGNARLVVILYDYVSHSVSNALKQQANKSGIPLVFCRNSTHELRRNLEGLALGATPCRCCDMISHLKNFIGHLVFWATETTFTPEQGKEHRYESDKCAGQLVPGAGNHRLLAAASGR